MSLISLSWRKIAHFWIGNLPVPKNENVDGHEPKNKDSRKIGEPVQLPKRRTGY
jgi:hypothetical protein